MKTKLKPLIEMSHNTKEALVFLDKISDDVKDEIKNDFFSFITYLQAQKTKACKETHYENIDEYYKPIYSMIRDKMVDFGFVNGDPEKNRENWKAQFWFSIYQLVSNIIYSPNLKTEVSTHHSSAYERNEALIIESDFIKTKL